MSDNRVPTLVLLKKLPQKEGKILSTIKIEAFPARLWADKLRPWSKSRQQVRIDGSECLIICPRDLEGLYRVRVNDVWFCVQDGKYFFMSEEKIYDLLRLL